MQTLILWTPHPQHSDKCVAPKKTEKPRHHRSRLAPTASPRRRALRFCATPQEPDLRHRQGPIPLSAHRGRLEHVDSYQKPLPRGRSPPARRHSALLRRRATPAEAHAPPAAAPHLPTVHIGPRSPLRVSAPGTERGPFPLNGSGGVRQEKDKSAGGERSPWGGTPCP